MGVTNADTCGIGIYLDGKRSYESIFGVMFDVCAQTDCPLIGEVAFGFIVQKANLLEMFAYSAKVDTYHGPTHGRQEPWGRWNDVLEDMKPTSGENALFLTVQLGAASSSAGLEGGINKK